MIVGFAMEIRVKPAIGFGVLIFSVGILIFSVYNLILHVELKKVTQKWSPYTIYTNYSLIRRCFDK